MLKVLLRLSPLAVALMTGCGLATDGETNFSYELEAPNQTLDVVGEVLVKRVRVDQPSLVVVHPSGLVGDTVDFTKVRGVAAVATGTEENKIIVLNSALSSGEKLHAFLYIDKDNDKAFNADIDVLVRDINARTISSSFVVSIDANTADVHLKLTADSTPAYYWKVVYPVGANNIVAENANSGLVLKKHLRYRIENAAPIDHPLQLAGGGSVLLGEGENNRPFASDTDVNWTNNNALVFTLSESLAQQLDGYRCKWHSSMTGVITVVE